jgi:hypothetical protein
MSHLFVFWLGDKPIEKAFTSLRIILWANVLNRLLSQPKSSFLMMFHPDTSRSFIDLFHNLHFLDDEEQDFLQISSADQQQTIEKQLQSSNLISYDGDNRMLVNIEHVDSDYLLKSSNDTSGK